MAVRGDIRVGQTKNPILAQAWIRQSLWEMFGLTLEAADKLPWQERDDLITIAQAHGVLRREAAQSAAGRARESAPVRARAMMGGA